MRRQPSRPGPGRAARASATPLHLDVSDAAELHRALTGSDLVVNCVGPFYRFGPPILDAAIEAGRAVRGRVRRPRPHPARCSPATGRRRRARGVRARRDGQLAGPGQRPRAVLRRPAARRGDHRRHHAHPRRRARRGPGRAQAPHPRHAVRRPDLAGRRRSSRCGCSSTAAGRTCARWTSGTSGTYPVYPYPHPETITLPAAPARASSGSPNRGVVFPLPYFELTREMVRAGTCGTDPIEVDGAPVVPIDFAVAHLMRPAPAPARRGRQSTGPAGCLRIDVTGEGRRRPRYVFSLSSSGAGRRRGHRDPGSARGAVLMARGEITDPGVHPPEAVVDPLAMLALAGELLPRLDVAGTGRPAADPHRAHRAGRHPRGAAPGPSKTCRVPTVCCPNLEP